MITESFALFEPDTAQPVFLAERNRDLLRYWMSLRQGRRLPSRADFDPGAIKTLLPYVMLTELVGAEARIRYRLVGTAIAEFAKFDFTGRFVDELLFQDGDDDFDFTASYRQVAAAGLPGRGTTYWIVPGDNRRWIEFVICPFASDGETVDQFVAIESYEPLEYAERDSLVPVKKK